MHKENHEDFRKRWNGSHEAVEMVAMMLLRSGFWVQILPQEMTPSLDRKSVVFGMKHGVAAQNYTMFMIAKYGKSQVDQMLADSGKPIKLYARDYREMLAEFNAEIKHQRSRLL
jgi:hypothetical protein